MTASERVAERIRREGPIPFDAFVDLALYGDGGFFSRARGAGRAGRDFVTSPEVGPLFGVLVGRALDGWWRELESPDPFLVVDAGAGRGRLARDVLTAQPECARALRYVLVERSSALREAQRELLRVEPFEDALGPVVRTDDDTLLPVAGIGPIATALEALPAVAFDGVVLANELLDNLPCRIVERVSDGWAEVRVTLVDDQLTDALVPALSELAAEAEIVAAHTEMTPGTRLPVPTRMPEWLQSCAATLRHGLLVVVDYVATADQLVERGHDGWLRTYRAHRRGDAPLVEPGEQDITVDVPSEYLVHAATRAGFRLVSDVSQAEWLASLGVESLVEEARAGWEARAHVGDLEAVRHRSRVTEASALLDRDGLGGHRVLVFSR